MFPEIQVTVKEKAKMFGVIIPLNRNIVEAERGMIRLLMLVREDNLYSLLRYIWIELHLPLISPLSCLKVLSETSIRNINAVNSGKKRRVISKKFDIGRNIICKTIDIN